MDGWMDGWMDGFTSDAIANGFCLRDEQPSIMYGTDEEAISNGEYTDIGKAPM
jgi:hypothetical protein